MSNSMNLKPWEHFLAVAAFGSLTRAAQRLGIAQPALSREMMELERQLSIKLFVRHARGLQLTVAGENFRTRSQSVLEDIRALRSSLLAEKNVPAGRLAVGVPPAMNAMLTTKVLELYCTKYPQVSLYVVEGPTNELGKSLVDRQIDVAVLSKGDSTQGLSMTPLLSEALFLVGKKNSLPKTREIPIKTILDLPLIMSPLPNVIHRTVQDAYLNHKAVPRIMMETNTWSLVSLIGTGKGYTFMPDSGRFNFPPNTYSSVRVKGLRIEWFIAALSYRPPSVAAVAFSQTVQECARAVMATGAWKTARPWQA
jgi:LysR family transcriptional regulator, nitrogen assimilation regulatory protein